MSGTGYLAQTEGWLAEHDLAESNDPLVASIRGAARELEDLDNHAIYPDLTDTKRVQMRRSARHSYHEARKLLQALIDRHDSSTRLKRHQVVFAGIAADSLGFFDLGLLRPKTLKRVTVEVHQDHGIDLPDFNGMIVEG